MVENVVVLYKFEHLIPEFVKNIFKSIFNKNS